MDAVTGVPVTDAGGRAGGAVTLTVIGAVLWWPWGAASALPAMLLGLVASASRRRRRCRRLEAEIDVLVALVELALLGGLSVRRALTETLPWLPSDTGASLAVALQRAELDGVLADELDALAADEPPWRGVAEVVGAAERHGAPAAHGLRQLADERLLSERLRLERAVRQVPVRLLLPLVGGVFPAFVLLAVVPMLAGALGGLSLLGY